MSIDKIYTINDYYDGPVEGVTSLNGEPHVYKCIFDHNEDEYSKNYYLQPISNEILTLVLEQWEIWLRWKAAFDKGLTTRESHPSLPAERKRYDEIQNLIQSEINIIEESCKIMQARFQVPSKPNWEAKWLVQWIKPSSNI